MEFSNKINIDSISLPQNPIFIVGMSRSGTTLLQALLTSQKNTYSLPETHFFNILYSTVGACENIPVKASSLELILNNVNKRMGLSFNRDIMNKLRARINKNDLYMKDLFEIIVYPYLCKQSCKNNLSSIHWIEKTPFHYSLIDKIEKFYPQAQFVNIMRNPLFAIPSRKKNIPSDKNKSIKTMSHGWNAMINSFNTFKQENPDKIYLIKYEDLVNQTEENMGTLCKFLNISFNPDLLENFWKTSKELILPWEKWKEDVSSKIIYNNKSKTKTKAGFINTLRIQNLTGRNMLKYNYTLLYPHIQLFFNLALYPFNVLEKILAHTKNIAKNILRNNLTL